MDRKDAIALLDTYLKTENLYKHSLAVEAIMRALAARFEPESVDLWGATGLLHDLDADLVDYRNTPELHGPETVRILKESGFGDERLYRAIQSHNKYTGISPEMPIERGIYAADPISGFIIANALVLKEKKLSQVQVSSIVKRMGEKRFAAGADREAMLSIESLGISFEEFAELSLEAVQPLAEVFGL